ncbi:hypothetical protein COB55_00500 [Candidatus Wolfebacteria bacterium]|nr:MAG: hypothetical protein COB55_00500 [Candidatus Wolfebacteria bacterium]
MKYKKKVLKNGLRIIVVPMKDNPTVTVMTLVEAGSKYEDKSINGLSHFLEHMCFKGTKRRPNAIAVSQELDSIGANSNAYTSHEYTGYYAKAGAKQFGKILDIVADMYINPLFKQSEIDKERGVIIEEINLYQDLPMRIVWDVYTELLYGDQPVGRTIIGPKENINKFTSKDFRTYRDKHYVASATTVIVAGNVDTTKVFKEVEKAFAGISTGKKAGKKKVDDSQKKASIKTKFKKTDQAHLILGVRGVSLNSKDKTIAGVLAGVLGKGMSSRLFSKLRDEMGVCYYVRAGHDAETDHGDFSISTGVSVNRVEEVIGVLIDELKRLTVEEVPEEELKKTKEILNAGLMLNLEASDDIADFFGFQELYHMDINTPAEVAKKIRAVTSKDLLRVAKKLIKTDKLNLAIVGPYKDSKKFTKLLKIK